MQRHDEDFDTVLDESPVAIHGWVIIVWNDDINTFENVIKTLCEVCDHSQEQAEQCAMIIHYNGKCSVKNGDFDDLKIMQEKIISRKIQATLEEL